MQQSHEFINLGDDADAEDAMPPQPEPMPASQPTQQITIVAPDAPNPAVKFDGGKAPVYQGFLARFPRAIVGIAMVSEYGFRKYGTYDGWEQVPNALLRYTDAKTRHMVGQQIEGPYDDMDSGLAHALQEAWGALARAELLIQGKQIDIRRGNDIVNGKPVLGTAKAV